MNAQALVTKLTRLKVVEVSGVDAPAHEAPGWMVLKSKDANPEDEAYRKARQQLIDAEREAWKELREVMGTELFKKYVLDPDADLNPMAVAAALGGIIEEAEAIEKARSGNQPAGLVLPWRQVL